MYPEDKIQLFEDKRIRTAWDAEKEECFFSIVDVVAVLTDQPDQRHAAKYWSVLKTRLKKEGSELTTKCSQLKMRSADGENATTDRCSRHGTASAHHPVHSLVQRPNRSRLWLAHGRSGTDRGNHRSRAGHRPRVGNLSQKRATAAEWITPTRCKRFSVRKELTDEWDAAWGADG